MRIVTRMIRIRIRWCPTRVLVYAHVLICRGRKESCLAQPNANDSHSHPWLQVQSQAEDRRQEKAPLLWKPAGRPEIGLERIGDRFEFSVGGVNSPNVDGIFEVTKRDATECPARGIQFVRLQVAGDLVRVTLIAMADATVSAIRHLFDQFDCLGTFNLCVGDVAVAFLAIRNGRLKKRHFDVEL